MAGRRGRRPSSSSAAYKAALEKDKRDGTTGYKAPVNRSRSAGKREAQASRAAQKAKGDAAAKAAEAKGSAVGNYLGTDVDKARATATFDKEKSQRLREQSAKRAEAAKGHRGRGASRARDLARVHGRTDEEKIASQAGAARNRRVATDALTTFIPGGAGASALAKAGKVKKAAKGAQALLKTAKVAKAAKNVKNVKTLGQGVVAAGKQAVKKATGGGAASLAKRASKVAKGAANVAKNQAKYKVQGAAHAAARGVLQGRA